MNSFGNITARLPDLPVWLESLVLTLAVPVVGLLFNRQDPLFLKASFPWLWFGPLLAALRYGMAPGISGVALLAVMLYGGDAAGLISSGFPLHFLLGGALLVMLAGQFSSVWSNRLRRADQLSRHAAERFEQLSRAYFMVRHSHDRLEQNLVSRPVTLRQAMVELRRLLADQGGAIGKELAGELMVILAHYCSLSSAAIYAVRDGLPDQQPLATCGNGAPCQPDDLLLRSALESGTTAYQAVNRLTADQQSIYLVAAPLRSSSGTIAGVLLVRDMPFMALHRETLQILGVLLAYAADHLESARVARTILTVFPDCPVGFGAELVKMVHLRQDLDITSCLVVITLQPHPHLTLICQLLERQQRGLDHSWRRDLGWGVQFVTLMPFSGISAVEGFQSRLESILKNQLQLTLKSDGISFNYCLLSAEDPLVQLASLLSGE